MTEHPTLLHVIDVTDRQDLAAGDFAAWLAALRRALVSHAGMDVPCGHCNACCRSAYFIHIGPDETDTLAHVPAQLRFPAPGRNGAQVMGFDERGHCPMLIDERCSIYEHRPLACRRYDCRVFAATDLYPDDKPDIAARARRWRFAHADDQDLRRHRSVATVARWLRDHGALLHAVVPGNLTQLAVLAVETGDAAWQLEDASRHAGARPEPSMMAAAIDAAIDAASEPAGS